MCEDIGLSKLFVGVWVLMFICSMWCTFCSKVLMTFINHLWALSGLHIFAEKFLIWWLHSIDSFLLHGVYYDFVTSLRNSSIYTDEVNSNAWCCSYTGLNIKMSSYQYRDPHVKDKTVSWPIVHNCGNSIANALKILQLIPVSILYVAK